MNKLIYANFGRLRKDLIFWLCTVFMVAAGVFAAVKSEAALDRVFFIYAVIIGLVSSVFCGLFIGTEHGDGTLRNKLIVGHTKTSVYLANLIVSIAAGFIFCIAFILPMLVIGIARLGFFEMGIPSALVLFGITLALSAAFSGVFTLISMLLQNKAAAAVACILCFVVLFGVAAAVNSRLQEPEFYGSYVMSVTGVSEYQNEPNPNYLTGTKRELYQFALDFLPTGQSVQFVEMSMEHIWQLPLYSLLILILTSAAGVLAFQREDIR
jgi:ABC-2 type transport system permease protein